MKTKIVNHPIATMLLLGFLCLGVWSFADQETTRTDLTLATKKVYCELVYDSRIDPKSALAAKYEYITKLWANYGAYANYSNAEMENDKLETFKDYMDALNFWAPKDGNWLTIIA